MSSRIRVGVSACLLGHEVRFDGGHKRSRFLVDQVAELVDFVPLCPEIGIGMGTPRESVRLARTADGIRLVGPRSGNDYTEAMVSWSERQAESLGAAELSGFILKAGSPSCGFERVRVYHPSGMPEKNGVGIFARILQERWPHLPVEEEGRLNDPLLRENFFERVFAHRRLEDLFATDWTIAELVAFHTREKLLLLAHDPAGHGVLGRLVADAKARSREALAREYRERFLGSLTRLVRARQHHHVLQRVLGSLGKLLPRPERLDVEVLLEDFRAGLVPLVAPVSLLRHLVRTHRVTYLASQSYFDPHPKDLGLRNHVAGV